MKAYALFILCLLAWQGSDAYLHAAATPDELKWVATAKLLSLSKQPDNLRHNLPEWLVQWMAEQAETPAELIEAALLKAHKLRPPRAP